jgi:K(+)-stimulated pyrophosphate-energized sodium pump
MDELTYAAPAAGVLALVYAFWKTTWVNKQDPGDARMVEIAAEIRT